MSDSSSTTRMRVTHRMETIKRTVTIIGNRLRRLCGSTCGTTPIQWRDTNVTTIYHLRFARWVTALTVAEHTRPPNRPKTSLLPSLTPRTWSQPQWTLPHQTTNGVPPFHTTRPRYDRFGDAVSLHNVPNVIPQAPRLWTNNPVGTADTCAFVAPEHWAFHTAGSTVPHSCLPAHRSAQR